MSMTTGSLGLGRNIYRKPKATTTATPPPPKPPKKGKKVKE